MKWRKRSASRLRLYYASDVHGSDLCWRKFLNAATHYSANVLIMGGDLTGKALVPIVSRNGEFVARVIGEERVAKGAAEVEALERAIRHNGQYPLMMSQGEVDALSRDEALVASAFERAMLGSLKAWIDLADERLADKEVAAYVMPGNDDPWAVDEVLSSGARITACDERIFHMGDHELLSLGWSNRTPWDSPRELDEDDLYAKLRGLCDQLEDPSRAVLNVHVPPVASGLDTAIEIDESFRPVLRGGHPTEIPVGSSAVRQILEEVQPLLSLHGHVHESKGVTKIGRTVAINPGSDYPSGRLDGCMVDIAGDRVLTQRLVSG